MSSDVVSYGNRILAALDVTGYKVEAVDGTFGKVDEASDDVDGSHLVIVTGPWILGPKVLLPTEAVDLVDDEAERIYVSLSTDEIRDLPGYSDPE
jgi:hypothetical protein